MQNIKIFGFDFGHGDTSLTSLVLDLEKKERPDKVKLFGSEKQITAISTVDDVTFIGDAACDLSNSKSLRIGFKTRPSRASEDDKALMKKYVSSIYEHLIKSKQISEIDNNIFCIGCPSGWTDTDMEAYQSLFLDCGIPNVVVVRESRAALMHAYESERLTKGTFINSVVLVIDIGSSTTDITITQGEKDNLVDCGYELGATYIDKMLLDYCLNLEQNKEIKKICSDRNDIKMYCELQCRKNKEEFFNNLKFFKQNSFPTRPYRIDKGVYFEFEIDTNAINQILGYRLGDNKDIKYILEKDENNLDIINTSWREAFKRSLFKAQKNIDEIIKKSNLKFSAILLTGGASQMDFISDICMEVFPDIKPEIDPKPEYTIANGLSRWGRTDIITKKFEDDINLFVEEKLPSILKREYPRLISMLTDALGDAITEKIVKKRIVAWRNGYISTLKNLGPDIANHAKKWLGEHEAGELIRSVIEEWLLSVSTKVERETDDICKKYQIAGSSLVKKNIEEFNQVNTKNFNANISVGDPTELGEVLGYISTVVIGIVLLLLTNILIFSGPIGWILGAIAFFVGRTFAENVIQDTDLPEWVRNFVTDEKIESSSAKISPEIQSKLNSALLADTSLENELTAKITLWISKGIEEESKKARLLII